MIEDLSVLTRPVAAPDDVVSYGRDSDQVADVRFGAARATERPLVMILHGGFWRPRFDRTHTGPMAVALAAAGWSVASIEYRRIPGQPDVMLEDIGLALGKLPALISRHNGRVIVVGHSAGGHLALWVAAKRSTARLSGVIALAPAADLQLAHDLNLGAGAVLAFLGSQPHTRTDIDPRCMPSPEIDTTLVHGEDDAIVPIAISESYVAAHPRARLIRVHDTGHFALIDPLSTAWPAVTHELERLARVRLPGAVPG